MYPYPYYYIYRNIWRVVSGHCIGQAEFKNIFELYVLSKYRRGSLGWEENNLGKSYIVPPSFLLFDALFYCSFKFENQEWKGGGGGMQPYSSPLNLPMTWSELLLVRDCYICRHGEGVYQGIHDRHKLVAFPVKGVYVINITLLIPGKHWDTRHSWVETFNNDFKRFYTWTCFKRILDLNGYLDMKPFQMPLLTNGDIK